MQIQDSEIVGIELSVKAINICHLNGNGTFLSMKQVKSPQYLIPGAVTIKLCEYFQSLNKNQYKFIGVALPANIICKGRVVKCSPALPGWVDVPLATWLEVRLGSTVILGDTQECECLGLNFRSLTGCLADESLAAMGVARLAYKKLITNSTPFTAG